MPTNKLVNGVQHGGIVVTDMESSLSFYRDMLGCKVVLDKTLSGEQQDATVGLKNVKLRVVILQVGQGETQIELLQFLHPPSKPLSPDAKSNDVGVRHIAFTVDDINRAYQELLRKGVKFNSPPQREPNVEWASVYLHDPDGAILEFTQLMRDK